MTLVKLKDSLNRFRIIRLEVLKDFFQHLILFLRTKDLFAHRRLLASNYLLGLLNLFLRCWLLSLFCRRLQ